jgi:hypothetical protein
MTQERRQGRAHQQMPAVDQERDGDDEHDVRRRCPQLDCGEFRAAGEIQPCHDRQFDDAQALLRGLGSKHQRIGDGAEQHRRA